MWPSLKVPEAVIAPEVSPAFGGIYVQSELAAVWNTGVSREGDIREGA